MTAQVAKFLYPFVGDFPIKHQSNVNNDAPHGLQFAIPYLAIARARNVNNQT